MNNGVLVDCSQTLLSIHLLGGRQLLLHLLYAQPKHLDLFLVSLGYQFASIVRSLLVQRLFEHLIL